MWALLILVILVMIIGIFYLRHRARNQALERMYGHIPNHVELYFVEYFNDIVQNWDLLEKEKAVEWADGMQTRLNSVSKEIEGIKAKSTTIDKDIVALENRIDSIETDVSKEEII